jgi:hypothetical protein
VPERVAGALQRDACAACSGPAQASQRVWQQNDAWI